jgi:hypothetical protein
MAIYYDRYQNFRVNGEIKPIIGITIPESTDDKYNVYRQGNTRLDKLSNLYYNNPYSGWLIMLANPEYGGLEFNIPDSSIIRIPFPYESAVNRYITQVSNNKLLYGE